VANIFVHTGYGVDVFFALSGYLICTLLLSEKRATQTISLRKFYIRRAFRILPIILAYLTVLFTLWKLDLLPGLKASEFLSVLGFVRNYVPGTWYTGHFWSLAIEEHFYLLIPLMFLLLKWRQAIATCTMLACITIVVRAIEYHFGLFSGSLLQFRTENRFDGLMWGAVLALLLDQPAIRDWCKRKMSGYTFILLVVAGAIGMTLLSAQPWRRTIAALVLPLLIAHTVLRPQLLLARWLEAGWVRWIGRLSYSIYVWQTLFLPEGSRPLGIVQNFPWAPVCILTCASISYFWIEKPLIRLGHKVAAMQLPERREYTLPGSVEFGSSES
jgi:peptidoglycan/LPS O-acetylase OafA/YrhL